GERQLQPAAQAETVHQTHHRQRQPLDAVEQAVDQANALDHLLLAGDALELVHVGADNETLLLARRKDQAANAAVAGVTLDPLDDAVELLERPLAERVLALTLAVEHRPGNALVIDREAPVPEPVHRCRHALPHSAARCIARALWPGVR